MYEKLIKDVEDSLTKQAQLLRVLHTLPELEGIRWQQMTSIGEIIICQPYDLEMFERNKQILLNAGFGWNKDVRIHPHCGYMMPVFFKDGIYVNLNVETDYEGSTCKRSIIGYEQKPIYEVTCMDA